MRKIILLSFCVIAFCSCKNKRTGWFIETRYMDKEYIRIIHSELNCKKIDGPVEKFDDNKVTYIHDGFCSNCISSDEISEYNVLLERRSLTTQAEEAINDLYKMMYNSYNNSYEFSKDYLYKSFFLTDNDSELERIYKMYYENKSMRNNASEELKKLFDLKKDFFIVRAKRWARKIKEGYFYIISMKQETSYDRNDLNRKKLNTFHDSVVNYEP